MSGNFLVACAAHVSHRIASHSRSLGGRNFCNKHLAETMHGFNPQVNDVVYVIDGPQNPYTVLARFGDARGDVVGIRRLGFPESPVDWISPWCLWPGPGAAHGYTRGCA